MIRKGLILKIFEAAYMQRWNDKLRPMELSELDKQAHKMIIAYFLGKFEEEKVPDFDWTEIIKGSLFELLQRVVVTDLKPPIFYKIKSDPEKYRKLNEHVYNNLKVYLTSLDEELAGEFQEYFRKTEDTIYKKILAAAHHYASKWEFKIIQRMNPDGFEINKIADELEKRVQDYRDLRGIQELLTYADYEKFVDLCGELRFQSRWSHLYRIPKTSVLGHSLFVALMVFLFSREIRACPRRTYNNFFTGLFHDLPEVLTRDIISPVKRDIEGLEDLIKEIETTEMEEKMYPLIPDKFREEIKFFTENEFSDIINGCELLPEGILPEHNQDEFNPRDGRLVKAADEMAVFIEAGIAMENGCVSPEFPKAMLRIRERYETNEDFRVIAGINFGELYADF